MQKSVCFAALPVLATVPTAWAADSGQPSVPPSSVVMGTDAPLSKWSGDAELGVIITTGNTSTRNVNAKFKLENERRRWHHTFTADYLRASDSGNLTAQRGVAALKSDYNLSEISYVVGTLRYENDQFSGYAYRVSGTAGYGRRLIKTPTIALDGEAGAGARHSKLDDGSREDDGIVRLAVNFGWKLSPTSEFREDVFTEAGQNNAHSESHTSLKVKVNGNFAMKLGVLVKHDTVVPAGKVKTDTLTSVTLVYDF